MHKRNVPYRSASTYYRLGAKLTLLISVAILISSPLPGISGAAQTILAAASASSPHAIASPATARARASATQAATARQGGRSTPSRRTIAARQQKLATLRQMGKPELLAGA